MSIAPASVALAKFAGMHIKEIRLARLAELLLDHEGSKAKLAKTLKKAPAQVSQWFNGVRTITEDTARQIEHEAKKPTGWLDTPIGAVRLNTAIAAESTGQFSPWPFRNIPFAKYFELPAQERQNIESYAEFVFNKAANSGHIENRENPTASNG